MIASCIISIHSESRELTFEEFSRTALTEITAGLVFPVIALPVSALASVVTAATFFAQQVVNITGGLVAFKTRELGPVYFRADYDIGEISGSEPFSLSSASSSAEIPKRGIAFDPNKTYTFHIHLSRTGGEKVYSKWDPKGGLLQFSSEENEWDFYYNWGEIVPKRKQLCGRGSLSLTLVKWKDVHTPIFKIVASEYCKWEDVILFYNCQRKERFIGGNPVEKIWSCSQYTTYIGENGEQLIEIEGGIENNTEAYAYMRIVDEDNHVWEINSNKIIIQLPSAYIFEGGEEPSVKN
jgi:hypothetical protein